MKNSKKILALFLSLLKIGAFTFGGGYAMIAILQREFVDEKKWIDKNEFIDLVAIAESTPGPMAINCATYIGYKVAGFWGSIASTVAVCLPSFVIIYLISMFFDAFLSFKYVEYAFKGIQVCVTYLILSAGIKMISQLKKDPMSVTILSLTVTLMVFFSVFSVNFSSIFFILISGAVGVFVYLIRKILKTSEKKEGGTEK